MSHRLPIARCGLSLAALTLGGLAACQAQGPVRQRGETIEFSAPKSAELTNSLRQSTGKRDGLKQLEEDLYRPFRSFRSIDLPEDELQVPLPAPNAGAGMSRREREEEDRRKNWAFVKPEDMLGVRTMDDLLQSPDYGKDGLEKHSLSVMEQYILDESPRGGNAKKLDKSRQQDRFDHRIGQDSTEATSREDSENGDAPNVLGESGKSLKKLIEGNTSANAFDPPKSTFADIFGLGHHEPTPDEILTHKARMEEFRQILDPSVAAPAGDKNIFEQSLMDAAPKSASVTGGLTGLPGSTRHDGQDSSANGLNPLTATLPDLSASLNAPQPPKLIPTLPPVAAPSVTPPIPTFLAPRRQF